jgi:hypothetical protein
MAWGAKPLITDPPLEVPAKLGGNLICGGYNNQGLWCMNVFRPTLAQFLNKVFILPSHFWAEKLPNFGTAPSKNRFMHQSHNQV